MGQDHPMCSACTFTSFCIFLACSCFSLTTRKRANKNMMSPWPMSPNITANRNGKVIHVNGAGNKSRKSQGCQTQGRNCEIEACN